MRYTTKTCVYCGATFKAVDRDYKPARTCTVRCGKALKKLEDHATTAALIDYIGTADYEFMVAEFRAGRNPTGSPILMEEACI